MRWPIRNQILLPFLTIQLITVLAVAASSAWIAVRQVDEEIAARLESVVTTLETASYPLTSNILDQLHRLSGAHFVIDDERTTIAQSTMQDGVLPQVDGLTIQTTSPHRSLFEDRAVVTVANEQFFAGTVRRRSGSGPEAVLVLYPESRLAAARWEAVFPPLLLGGSLLLLTLLCSVWISRRIARRIQKVEQHVARVAGGDFTPMPVLITKDELRDLSRSVNRMAVVLEQSMKHIRENERAELLTQLVGGLAHQLRNSLTGARVSIQLHQRRCASADDDAVEIALKQLTLTEEQIKALLRLSKGESRAESSLPLNELLDDVVSLVRPLSTHKKVELDYQRSNLDVTVTDGDAIRGALLNLIINAIEATPSHGQIQVMAEKDSQHVVISIIDDGHGISEEIAEEIFTPFFSTKPEGAGLGLALARQAAEDCGGSLTVELAPKTMFRLKIPIAIRSQPFEADRSLSVAMGKRDFEQVQTP